MKNIKLSNSFFVMLGLFSLVVALGTGCSSSGDGRPPADPETDPSITEPNDSGAPGTPPPAR